MIMSFIQGRDTMLISILVLTSDGCMAFNYDIYSKENKERQARSQEFTEGKN